MGLSGETGALSASWARPAAPRGPGAVAVSPSSGNLYVADAGLNDVLVYSPAGELLDEWGSPTPGAAGPGTGEFNDRRDRDRLPG